MVTLTATTTRKRLDTENNLRAELRRHRLFVERLCAQMRAELESLKCANGEQLLDTCDLLQSNLSTIAAAASPGTASKEVHEVFDLHMVAKTAVARHAFTADNYGVRLRCLVHREAPRRVVGDRFRLAQLLGDIVATVLPSSSAKGLYVFVAQEPSDTEGATVRFTICDSESGPPAVVRSALPDRSGGSLWVAPWYASMRELVRRMGGSDIGFQATEEGVAIWLTVSLGTTAPRPKRSQLETKAPVLLVTKDASCASAVGNALRRCGLVVDFEPHEQLLPIRMQESNYGLVLMDNGRGAEVATFAARIPGSTEMRMVPMVGLPRRDDRDGTIDEVALLDVVQKRLGVDQS